MTANKQNKEAMAYGLKCLPVVKITYSELK
jgi:hypothetical protein